MVEIQDVQKGHEAPKVVVDFPVDDERWSGNRRPLRHNADRAHTLVASWIDPGR